MLDFFDSLSADAQDMLVRAGLIVLALLLIWVLRGVFVRLVLRPVHGLTKRTSANWDDEFVSMVDQPARYIFLAVALILAGQLLDLEAEIQQFIGQVARSIIIGAVFVSVYRAIDYFALSRQRLLSLTGIRVEAQLLPFIRTATKLLTIAFAIVMIVQEWGYNVSGLIAGLGLGGLAFSLAAKDTVENLFGFSTIVSDRPFVVGDYIVTPDVEGIVEKVGLRSTQVRGLNQSLIFVPNAHLATSVITNWSSLSRRWVQFVFGVTYSTGPEEMQSLIRRVETMLARRRMVDSSTIQVMFTNFAASSLDVEVRCYVRITDWYEWRKESEAINLEIMKIVDDLGLSMAFPSQSVYVEQLPARSGANDPSAGAGNGHAGTGDAQAQSGPAPAIAHRQQADQSGDGPDSEGAESDV